MEELQSILENLSTLKIIKAEDKKLTLETKEGNINISYILKTLTGRQSEAFGGLPLQILLNIRTENDAYVSQWGCISNTENAQIIDFFNSVNMKHLIKQMKEDENQVEKIKTLLNL